MPRVLPSDRWFRRTRDGAVALVGAGLGFFAVYVAHGPAMREPAAAPAIPSIVPPRRPAAPVTVEPKAFVAREVPAPPPPPRRYRPARRAAAVPPPLAGEALARAYAEDAAVTKRLNEAAMARLAQRGEAAR